MTLGKVFVLIVSILLGNILAVSAVDARAGGGHSSVHTSSPSSSHASSIGLGSAAHFGSYPVAAASSTSGGGAGGALIFVLIAVAVIGYVLYAQSQKKSGAHAVDMSGIPTDIADIPNDTAEGVYTPDSLDQLRQRDPAFHVDRFKDYVSTAFFAIQRAWSMRDMLSARAYISDNVLKRFTLQLEDHKAKHTINRIDELSLDMIEIESATTDDRFDTINLMIRATAKDYTQDEQTGSIVSGDADEYTTWRERWKFIRSVKATTQSSDSAEITHCPSCGAPLKMNMTGECEYCHSNITKGDFDWVLSEIEQVD